MRPVMLGIGGDSASGKTTMARGLVEAIGPDRCTTICVDDYHRHERAERHDLPITPLHPDGNYIDVMEQHLQMLAMNQPILKPVYDHSSGTLQRPQYVQPRQFVIVEGLFPLFTKLSRGCFDISVFLDPPEPLRCAWKIARDTTERGYTSEQSLADLVRREPDSAAYIRPQRDHADIVVRFAPVAASDVPLGTPLSAELLLRSTVQQPPLSWLLSDEAHPAIRLKIVRDTDGTPLDCLQVHGNVDPEQLRRLQRAIWDRVSDDRAIPPGLGELAAGEPSATLGVTQLILLYHLAQEVYQD